jgi:hypothetical protein
MQRAFTWTIGLSLALHVGAAATFVTRRAPAPEAEPPPPTFAGETFDLSEALTPSTTTAPDPEPTGGTATAPPPPSRAPRSNQTSQGATGSTEEPQIFGAVGDRSAVDIIVAFKQAFPQAESGDPIWNQVPFGSVGTIDVELDLDDTGHLVATHTSEQGSAPLHQAVLRTLALIGARSFTAKSLTTKLRITGRVSPDEVHDGYFAIGNDERTSYFELPSGRRVDVTVSAIER